MIVSTSPVTQGSVPFPRPAAFFVCFSGTALPRSRGLPGNVAAQSCRLRPTAREHCVGQPNQKSRRSGQNDRTSTDTTPSVTNFQPNRINNIGACSPETLDPVVYALNRQGDRRSMDRGFGDNPLKSAQMRSQNVSPPDDVTPSQQHALVVVVPPLPASTVSPRSA